MSADGGQTWINKTTAALDGNNCLDIVYQGGTNDVVYIVSINNVFYWDASANDWVNYTEDLPFVINPLHFRPFYRDQKIRLASSRGVWEAPLAVASAPLAQPMTFTDKVYCSRDTVQFDCYSVLDHAGAQWQWNFSPQPQYVSNLNVRNPKVVLGQDGYYTVTLTVTDGNGLSSTKTVANMIELMDNCSPDTIPGLAMRCLANGDYANVPDLGIGETNTFTVSAWIKPNGTQDEYTGIVMGDGSAAGLNFRPNMALAYHWPGGQWWWNSGLIVPADVWSHVAMVVSPNSITVYLNGVAATHNIAPQMADIQTMKIGSYQAWDGRNFRGEIDEVCIWNRSLTQNEIRELRHLTRTGPTPYTDDLVAYYQFNLPNTVIINDRIGLNHASLNGGATKVASSAPVGGGVSDRLTIAADGTVIFPNTQTTMILAPGTAWTGEVVVSRLHVDPNVSPNSNSNINQYWIVNNYGSTPALPLQSVTFTTTFITPTGAAANVQLSTRGDNAHLDNWNNLCTAANITGNSILFNNTCNISNFGQFVASSPNFTQVSIDEVLENNIMIYPNPSTGIFHIALPSNQTYHIEVVDNMGRVVLNQSNAENTSTIDLSDQASGVYLIRLIDAAGNVSFGRVVKR
jgi:PKD repeat protein